MGGGKKKERRDFWQECHSQKGLLIFTGGRTFPFEHQTQREMKTGRIGGKDARWVFQTPFPLPFMYMSLLNA